MNTQVTVLDRPTTPTIDLDALLATGQERGAFQPLSIDNLQKTLGELITELDPRDEVRPLNQASVRYINGKVAVSLRELDGAWGTPTTLTHRAYRQLGAKVLGPRGLDFIERQRQTDATGERMATINWLERLAHADKQGLFRTMQFPGEQFRTIRGVLSGSDRGFTTNLDHLDVVNLLADSPEFRALPVIDWKVTPDTMRIRFLLEPGDGALFNADGRLLNPTNSHDTSLKIPVPMGEIYNGEVGNHALSFTNGTFTFACLNGMGSWGSDSFTQRWAHIGGDDRGEKVQSALGDAIKSSRVASSGLVQGFKDATQVAVMDAFALLDQWGRKEGLLTAGQARRAATAANDETSYPGRNLAAVISGVTLAAQDESDMDQQRAMERFAARLMEKGLRKGSASGEIVLAEA